MQPLDPIAIPLTGRHLIEASAGTGKTYAITGIYLRLLLERELNPAQILVVTYTEAACQELRDKIRTRLSAAAEACASGNPGDAYLASLFERYRSEGRDEGRLRVLVDLALINFDMAAVFTIHGFCLRVLQDSAFESGFPFELDFIEDDRELLQQVVDDFWRQSAPAWPMAVAAYLHQHRVSPDTLVDILRRPLQAILTRGASCVRFGPSCAPGAVDLTLFDRLQALWQDHRDELVHTLLTSPALSRSADNFPLATLRPWFQDLDDFFCNGTLTVPPLSALEGVSSSALRQGAKPSKVDQVPDHPFFAAADTLIRQLEEAKRGVIRGFIEHSGPALAMLKAERGQVGFDDLLTAVRAGLRAPDHGPELVSQVRSRYPVALIDEFQDTDPVQYEIFTSIFQGESALFMVGDPKQAIYGFRGADIFSYLQAAKAQVDGRHTLVTNWRSEPSMIQACNAIFARHPRPFVLPGIDFHEAKSPDTPRRRLTVTGMAAAMTICTFDDEAKKGEAKSKVAAWVATAVQNLLSDSARGEAFFEEKGDDGWHKTTALTAGDIAILVRSHRDGQMIKEALACIGLAAVLSSRHSVFDSEEARELRVLLEAVALCADERKVRRALATRLLSGDALAFSRFEEEESAWEETLERFASYRALWLERGVAAMLRSLWVREAALPKLVRYPSGERRMTNLRHLTELLQEAAASEALGPVELLHWFDERRRGYKAEATLLRLESDEDLIKIVTVHKSKGLQYPVVFVPFCWDSALTEQKAAPMAECHDQEGALVVDLGSDALNEHRLRQRRETLAEELRLFYVAVTRAENRCLLFWGRVNSRSRSVTASSPLQYLINGRAEPDADVAAALERTFSSIAHDQALALVNSLVTDTVSPIAVIPVEVLGAKVAPGAMPPTQLGQARVFRRVLHPNLHLRSFTSLHKTAAEIEAPDYDSVGAGGTFRPGALPCPAVRDMFSFPRGAQAGSCLHAIMEHLDFQENSHSVLESLVQEKLAMFGFGREWVSTILDLLARMVDTPLDVAGELRLQNIAKSQRLDELEFYYRLPAESDQALRAMILHGQCPALASNHRSAFMKGFIDLVFQWREKFYILDYKSNYLGSTLADYGQDRLAQAMAQAGYDLQYRIYVEALHRYLGRRLPGYDYERHFGGVYYLFLRGLAPEAGPRFGVYYARPSL